PACSDGRWSADVPWRCATVAVCKNHLSDAYERHKEPHTTQKDAPQLVECPARSDGRWSTDVPWRCAALVVCKNHLSGAYERHKEPHTTQKYAPQLVEC